MLLIEDIALGCSDGYAVNLRAGMVPALRSNDTPAEPEAFQLLAPQRGLIATVKRSPRIKCRGPS
jgi:hypothetical protein